MLLRFDSCLALLSEPLSEPVSLAGGDGGDIGDACPESNCTLSACARGLPLTDAGICAGALTRGAVAVTSWQDGPRDQEAPTGANQADSVDLPYAAIGQLDGRCMEGGRVVPRRSAASRGHAGEPSTRYSNVPHRML